MLEELSVAKKVSQEFFIDLMTEKVMSMSEGIHTSSTRIVQASSSIAQAGPSWSADEKRTKHRDNLVDGKLIPIILPAYLPAMSGAINRDNVPREFEYALVTTYLPKGIRVVHADQENITALKFRELNLSDKKVYNMLAPHKYLTRTKGNNSKIVPQSWTMNLA
jgi:hypothetical protein